MAFKSEKSTRLMSAAKTYLSAWQPQVAGAEAAHQLAPAPGQGTTTTRTAAAGSTPTRLEALLSEVVSPGGVTFLADGVVHLQDRHKNVHELAEHILERYAAYRHVVHEPFAMAVNEDENEVFLGVRFVMQNTGPLMGREPTGRPSSGVLLERLGFDADGRINTALVCRQLTREEIDRLTIDPSAVHPPPISDEELFAPQEQLSPEALAREAHCLKTWVSCWDTTGDLNQLNQVLDPGVRQLSGYGLGKRSVPFAGIDGARAAIKAAHERVDNVNSVIAHGLCDDRRAGFVHWRANCLDASSRALECLEGLDYVRFNQAGQVGLIFSFTMRPYDNIRGAADAPRSAGVD